MAAIMKRPGELFALISKPITLVSIRERNTPIVGLPKVKFSSAVR